ncbi:hypothetical protein KJ865_17510, partial [Myxococcota bacterium]|nr:hypothetical protein [Myxococcota bacterium]
MKRLLGIPLLVISLVMLGLLVRTSSGIVMKMLDKGFTPFYALGIIALFFFWITLFGAFLKTGLSLLAPHKYSKTVIAARDLEIIYRLHIEGGGILPGGQPTEVPYESYTDQQLVGIYDNIKQEDVPLRYAHLLRV